MTNLRTVSYGAGVQSTSLLVLAAQGRIDFRIFLFANVGDDSEDPGTLTYLEHVAKPYAAYHGIEMNELRRTRADGTPEVGLYEYMTRPGSKALPIPVRGENGMPMKRTCTSKWKIEVIGAWLKTHGASEHNRATVAQGISLDEIHRINGRKAMPYEVMVYPLVFELEPALRRNDCEQVIVGEPLPPEMADHLRKPEVLATLPEVTRRDLLASDFTRMPRPPSSQCWFCPHHRPDVWAEMRRDRPDLFTKSCALEAALSDRGPGQKRYWLTRFNGPLEKVITEAQDMLPLLDQDDDNAGCDNGWCMT